LYFRFTNLIKNQNLVYLFSGSLFPVIYTIISSVIFANKLPDYFYGDLVYSVAISTAIFAILNTFFLNIVPRHVASLHFANLAARKVILLGFLLFAISSLFILILHLFTLNLNGNGFFGKNSFIIFTSFFFQLLVLLPGNILFNKYEVENRFDIIFRHSLIILSFKFLLLWPAIYFQSLFLVSNFKLSIFYCFINLPHIFYLVWIIYTFRSYLYRSKFFFIDFETFVEWKRIFTYGVKLSPLVLVEQFKENIILIVVSRSIGTNNLGLFKMIQSIVSSFGLLNQIWSRYFMPRLTKSFLLGEREIFGIIAKRLFIGNLLIYSFVFFVFYIVQLNFGLFFREFNNISLDWLFFIMLMLIYGSTSGFLGLFYSALNKPGRIVIVSVIYTLIYLVGALLAVPSIEFILITQALGVFIGQLVAYLDLNKFIRLDQKAFLIFHLSGIVISFLICLYYLV
jgi:O-antigen/teichoic acid export membrane protein